MCRHLSARQWKIHKRFDFWNSQHFSFRCHSFIHLAEQSDAKLLINENIFICNLKESTQICIYYFEAFVTIDKVTETIWFSKAFTFIWISLHLNQVNFPWIVVESRENQIFIYNAIKYVCIVNSSSKKNCQEFAHQSEAFYYTYSSPSADSSTGALKYYILSIMAPLLCLFDIDIIKSF